MSLSRLLQKLAAADRPIRIGQIGAGKFGTMFLSQVRLTPGMHLVGLADLMPARARERLAGVGWPAEQFAARSMGDAFKSGGSFVTDDALAVIESREIDVVIEATGDPATGIELALAAARNGKHVIMVNVEADALAGPLLARRAREAGVLYSLAWGDQPALICEQVDWARTCGFKVVAAGKGTRYHPSYHQSTPDTVWDILTQYLPIQDRSHINPKMFNSFLDGTKSGIEMTAVCNATGLVPQSGGLGFPPATRFELADVCKPRAEGGTLETKGVTEVVSSLYRDGTDVPHHLAMGTYVVIESDSPYASAVLRRVQLPAGQERPVRRALPPHAHDRPGARHLRRLRDVAPGAYRRALLLQLRRGRHGEAHTEKGRGARRRGRLHGVGPAGAGRRIAGGELSAPRPRERRDARARHRRGPAAPVVGCRHRRQCNGGEGAPRDGGDVRQGVSRCQTFRV